VPETLSAAEVGKEAHEHATHAARLDETGHHGLIMIVEAVLLSVVTLAAAWSGYSAARWEGVSNIHLTDASRLETHANRAYQSALIVRAQDAVNFSVWFNAYLNGDVLGQAIAEKRFRLGYDTAFRAWIARDPFANPNAPKAPQYMPQYTLVGLAEARRLDTAAEDEYASGHLAAKHGQDYIRVTVILASVLFIVGISSHFRVSGIRIGLAVVGTVLLILGAIAIIQLPWPSGQ
jgi:hypothetical protein